MLRGHAGGADELPPELAQYVTGYLEETLTGMYRRWKRENLVLYGRAESIEWIRPDPEARIVTAGLCQ